MARGIRTSRNTDIKEYGHGIDRDIPGGLPHGLPDILFALRMQKVPRVLF